MNSPLVYSGVVGCSKGRRVKKSLRPGDPSPVSVRVSVIVLRNCPRGVSERGAQPRLKKHRSTPPADSPSTTTNATSTSARARKPHTNDANLSFRDQSGRHDGDRTVRISRTRKTNRGVITDVACVLIPCPCLGAGSGFLAVQPLTAQGRQLLASPHLAFPKTTAHQ